MISIGRINHEEIPQFTISENPIQQRNEQSSPEQLDEKCQNTLDKMRLDNDTINFVNKSTATQSNTIDWHQQRTGRITSSTVHALMHTNPQTASKICYQEYLQSEYKTKKLRYHQVGKQPRSNSPESIIIKKKIL